MSLFGPYASGTIEDGKAVLAARVNLKSTIKEGKIVDVYRNDVLLYKNARVAQDFKSGQHIAVDVYGVRHFIGNNDGYHYLFVPRQRMPAFDFSWQPPTETAQPVFLTTSIPV